jgi:hypothetical protein
MEAKIDTVIAMFKSYQETMEAYLPQVYQEERWAEIKTNEEEMKASQEKM